MRYRSKHRPRPGQTLKLPVFITRHGQYRVQGCEGGFIYEPGEYVVMGEERMPRIRHYLREFDYIAVEQLDRELLAMAKRWRSSKHRVATELCRMLHGFLDEPREVPAEVLDAPLGLLWVNNRTLGVLTRVRGLDKVKDVVKMRQADVLKLSGFGKTALKDLRRAMVRIGVTFEEEQICPVCRLERWRKVKR